MTFPPKNAWDFPSAAELKFLQLARAIAEIAFTCSNCPQNLLIVTGMSFDRAGKFKHNTAVQTRAKFLPNSARHARAALPFLCFVCAKPFGSFEFVGTAGLGSELTLSLLPHDGQKADR